MPNNLSLNKINIAIDGYSSCGKGTLAKQLAQALNYIFIDSGAMYRAVTLYFINENIDPNDSESVNQALKNIHLEFRYSKEKEHYEIYLNGSCVDDEIRELHVASKVSQVAKISAVRRKLVEMQQEIGKSKGVVMDGRDIGTVVFPNAELKIFMTASTEVRAQRRFAEMIQNGKQVTLEEVTQNLTERDSIDSAREDSPLTLTNDYQVLDNSTMSREAQFDLAMSWVNQLLD